MSKWYLRGIWASALRLPSRYVLVLRVEEQGKGMRIAVRVQRGQSIDSVYQRIQTTAQVNSALRLLE
eukprot:CAMPEP_0179492102 /NCGR_PEP_ID=MMETSP0799-20121207/66561_1 /TAXON_ID=46947 /ORGANISM="Geminigera cryophila, Strain CCMP2564" /LENGTH=66 /DNA_ID=CAMNT_0021308835 /DNA_START=1 /DNA_END=198 /DNA_ORIENTATION=-